MIKGLSKVRRLPRLGKIRLGMKQKKEGGAEYPVEVDYFILDPSTPSLEENEELKKEFHRLYGEKPKQIKIMIPLLQIDVFFPQFYKRYGGSILKCRGDGETAVCITEKEAANIKVIGRGENFGYDVECKGRECPYYLAKKCTESASLFVILPELKGAGVWQITTGSFNSIVTINSCLEYILAVCGRFHMIPLTLERREQVITHDGKTSKHYILNINMDVRHKDLQMLATIATTKILLDNSIEPGREEVPFLEDKINPDTWDGELISETQCGDLLCLLQDNKDISKGMFRRYLKGEYGVDNETMIHRINFSRICLDITENKQNILKYSGVNKG